MSLIFIYRIACWLCISFCITSRYILCSHTTKVERILDRSHFRRVLCFPPPRTPCVFGWRHTCHNLITRAAHATRRWEGTAIDDRIANQLRFWYTQLSSSGSPYDLELQARRGIFWHKASSIRTQTIFFLHNNSLPSNATYKTPLSLKRITILSLSRKTNPNNMLFNNTLIVTFLALSHGYATLSSSPIIWAPKLLIPPR